MRRLGWMLVGLCACISGSGGNGDDAGPNDESEDHASGDLDAGPNDNHENAGPHAQCKRYIECAREATPTGVTPIIATYGDEGSCWTLPGVTESDCEGECAAARRALQAVMPSAACGECSRDSECDTGVCAGFMCVTIGICACPADYPECDDYIDDGDGEDDGDGDIVVDPGEDGVTRLPEGFACDDSSECESGLACASYKGQSKRCMAVCMSDASCSHPRGACSVERDSEGRGLCIECTGHADCGASGACRDNGTCGCRDDDACDSEMVCRH